MPRSAVADCILLAFVVLTIVSLLTWRSDAQRVESRRFRSEESRPSSRSSLWSKYRHHVFPNIMHAILNFFFLNHVFQMPTRPARAEDLNFRSPGQKRRRNLASDSGNAGDSRSAVVSADNSSSNSSNDCGDSNNVFTPTPASPTSGTNPVCTSARRRRTTPAHSGSSGRRRRSLPCTTHRAKWIWKK